MTEPRLTVRLAKRVARRALLADALRFGGWGLVAGGAAAVVGVGLVRGWNWDVPWIAVAGLAAGLGLACGLGVAVARRWGLQRAATELDRRLGLRDRLGSALALSRAPGSDGVMAELVVADAEMVATNARVAQAVIIRPGWSWAASLVLLAGTAAVGLWMPVGLWPQRDQLRRAAPTAETVAQVGAEIAAAREAVQGTDVGSHAEDAGTARELAALEEVERDLKAGRVDDSEGRARAAQAMERAAEKLTQKSEHQQAAADAVRQQLAKMERHAAPASALSRELGAGDISQAAAEAARLSEEYDSLPATEREKMARELGEMAAALGRVERDGPEGVEHGTRLEEKGKEVATGGKPGDMGDPSAGQSKPSSDGGIEHEGDTPSGGTTGRKGLNPLKALRETMENAAKALAGDGKSAVPKNGADHSSGQPPGPGVTQPEKQAGERGTENGRAPERPDKPGQGNTARAESKAAEGSAAGEGESRTPLPSAEKKNEPGQPGVKESAARDGGHQHDASKQGANAESGSGSTKPDGSPPEGSHRGEKSTETLDRTQEQPNRAARPSPGNESGTQRTEGQEQPSSQGTKEANGAGQDKAASPKAAGGQRNPDARTQQKQVPEKGGGGQGGNAAPPTQLGAKGDEKTRDAPPRATGPDGKQPPDGDKREGEPASSDRDQREQVPASQPNNAAPDGRQRKPGGQEAEKHGDSSSPSQRDQRGATGRPQGDKAARNAGTQGPDKKADATQSPSGQDTSNRQPAAQPQPARGETRAGDEQLQKQGTQHTPGKDAPTGGTEKISEKAASKTTDRQNGDNAERSPSPQEGVKKDAGAPSPKPPPVKADEKTPASTDAKKPDDAKPNSKDPSASSEPEDSQNPDKDGAQRSQKNRDASPRPSEGGADDKEDAASSNEPPSLPQSLPSKEALKRLAEQLQTMSKDAERPKLTREQAEKMQQRAQELLSKASPQEKQMLRELAEEMAKKNAGKGEPPPKGDNESEGQRPEGEATRGKNQLPQENRPSGQPPPGSSPGGGQVTTDAGSREERTPGGDQGSSAPGVTRKNAVHSPNNEGGSKPREDRSAAPVGTQGGDRTATRQGGDGSANDGSRIGERGSPVSKGPQSAPTDARNTVPVDARRTSAGADGGHVIADYIDPQQGGNRQSTSAAPALSEGVREAASGVERAIEQQAVPGPYSDLVRRVFKRYVDRVQPGKAVETRPASPRFP